MNTYIGSKLVTATSMTYIAYSHFRDDPLPEANKPYEEGFLVENPKGPANTLCYQGEVSWLPKLQFAAEYLSLGDIRKMPSQLQRLHGELAQLQEKLSELLLFIKSDKFFKLSFKKRELLLEQSRVMTRYLFILEDRIAD